MLDNSAGVRPLLRGRNEDWLFPDQRGGGEQSSSVGTQIVDTIHKATELRITIHQFRRAAGALLLEQFPLAIMSWSGWLSGTAVSRPP